MGVGASWRTLWAFKPGDPANRLHPRKYDLLYEFEDRYWWFMGMRRIQRSLVPELYIPRAQDGFRMLDAGCGTGGRLAALPEAGIRVGVDLSHHALAYAVKRALPYLIQAPIQRLPFPPDCFDVILSFDVVNLLEDDASAVRELKRVCKPGGVVFLSLPAFNFLGGRHSEAVGMVRRYTKGSLRRLLMEAGFEVQRITYTNCLLFPVVLLARFWSWLVPTKAQQQTGGFDFTHHALFVQKIFLAMLVVESWLLKWIDLPLGSTVTVRAVKQRPSQPRKILRVVTRLNIGGPAQQVVLLSQALNREGWKTVLVSGLPPPEEGDLGHRVDPSVPWIKVPGLTRAMDPLKDLTVWWRLLRLLRLERPDILHTHMAKAGALGRLAGLAFNALQRVRGSRRRLVMIHTFHGHVLSGYFGGWRAVLFTAIERWLARWTDVLIAVSPSVRDDLIQRGIGDPARLQVIPLGLDLSVFLQVEASSGALRRELGIAPEASLIGIVGRLAPIKQHDLFLHAAKALLARDPARRFVIVGDGERRAELEALARQLGLGAAVRFVGWRLDLPAVYADLDCVCLTSRNEGTPVSVIEALACARPVVATAVGGVPDLLGTSVERGEGYDVAQRGLLVQWPVQSQGFAAAVERMLADRALAARVGEAGRVFVREHLTAERLIRDLEGLYGRFVPPAREAGARHREPALEEVTVP